MCLLVTVFAVAAAAKRDTGRSTATIATACPQTVNDLRQTVSGSNFEVDPIVPPPTGSKKNALPTGGANLVVDGSSPCIDWWDGSAMRGTVGDDKPTGTSDNSFGQGTSEDDPVPTVVTGSIPPNKSDLTHFGVYEEKNSSGSFVALFWSRVQNPSGTTDMDFEFNQNKCEYDSGSTTPTSDSVCSSNGVTPVRTLGDKLLLYDLESGGSTVAISIRTWDGTEWGPAMTLDPAFALGSANYDAITSSNGGTLGALSPLTFGEAVFNLNQFLGGATCGGFGSVYLKSRSSTSFTSEIKDFISPKAVTISNCASIVTQARSNTIGGTNSIGDKAIMSGASSPTGTVTFDLYKFAASATPTSTSCTGKSTSSLPYVTSLTTSSWTLNSSTGNYEASVSWSGSGGTGLTASDLGQYRWVVSSYTGDAGNIVTGLPTGCVDTNERSDVTKAPSSISTAQKWYPNDTATITGGTGGTVTFTLYKNDSTCGSNGANTTNAVTNLSGISVSLSSGSASTSNGPGNTLDVPIASVGTGGDTYYWLAVYSGDTGHNGVTSCVESTQLASLANGSTVNGS